MYTTEYYATIKKDEFMSFAGTWMNLETIILRKLTKEQETKHRMFSLMWVLNKNTWTQGREHQTLGSVGEWRARGGIAGGVETGEG